MDHSFTVKPRFLGNSLTVQWLGVGAFTARVWVPSLVRKVRSHKKKRNNPNKRLRFHDFKDGRSLRFYDFKII